MAADRMETTLLISEPAPTRLSGAVFAAKATGLRLLRSLADLAQPPPRLAMAVDKSAYPERAATSVTALWIERDVGERTSELGKVHNLRRAAMSLDGLLIPAGIPFSFWRNLGRASRRRGFTTGRMLREGCVVASVGGGLCQLSNALYQVALATGCEILERHGHSRVVTSSTAEFGRDATVAWNYVDLRFKSECDLLLQVKLDTASLTVSLSGAALETITATRLPEFVSASLKIARSCDTCGETSCLRHSSVPQSSKCVAFVVDGAWPEFRDFVAASRQTEDLIALPLDGRRLGLARYGWNTEGFAKVIEAPIATLQRALAWRTTPPQGPARRAAEVRSSASIAAALGRKLPPEATHLVVAQSLAPFLWRVGWLGGRTFDLLMHRLPMNHLQARLDEASAAHPDRSTLSDYRAPDWLVEAEAEVVAAAQKIVTPHAEIAAMFNDRVEILDWHRPISVQPRPSRGVIAFPGPTVARKGAYELAAAAKRLGFRVRPLGAELEGKNFWAGVTLDRQTSAGHWLDGVAAVVQPAIVEESPRRLLEALSSGAPVIATPACGLSAQTGLKLIPAGDPDALCHAIDEIIRGAAQDSPLLVTVQGAESHL
jgi:hypothetical protein